jgi:Tfp pilus assembly protein PilZ
MAQSHMASLGSIRRAKVTTTSLLRRPMQLSYRDRSSFIHDSWAKGDETGIFVPGTTPLQIGEPLDLEILFAQPKMVFHFAGVVRWKRAAATSALPAGVGISFNPEHPETLGLLSDFVHGRKDPVCRNRRLPVALRVKCIAHGHLRTSRTENLSRGGAFILGEPPELGTLVSLGFKEGSRPIDLDAEVVWSREGRQRGFGVRFLQRSMPTQKALMSLVNDIQTQLAAQRLT